MQRVSPTLLHHVMPKIRSVVPLVSNSSCYCFNACIFIIIFLLLNKESTHYHNMTITININYNHFPPSSKQHSTKDSYISPSTYIATLPSKLHKIRLKCKKSQSILGIHYQNVSWFIMSPIFCCCFVYSCACCYFVCLSHRFIPFPHNI